jgi:hypothetical protein
MHPQIIIDHIRTATPKSRLNRRRSTYRSTYRPPSHKLAAERASDIVTGLITLVGVAGILAIAYIVTHK